MTMQHSRGTLFAYGVLGFPLAFALMPLYVHLPNYYASVYGMSLTLLGAILLAVRLLDTVQDPFIGWFSDRLNRKGISRVKIIAWVLPLLAICYAALFMVPDISASAVTVWLVAALLLVYTAFSIISINYYALGAELSSDYHERTRISTTREGFMLLGVLVASVLPVVLSQQFGMKQGFIYFALLFIPLLLLPAYILVRSIKPNIPAQESAGFKTILRNKQFRWFALVLLLSSVANAIPATLLLFFVKDVLQLQGQEGYFLFVYFLSGALGMPLWSFLARKYSKKIAWFAGMLLSIICFGGAYNLGAGDAAAFYIICALSGLALGADYALPPSMLADIAGNDGDAVTDAATYFGIWNFITKLTYALAAGIVLPLLGQAGYAPGELNTPDKVQLLSLCYALIPCAIKFAATLLLYVSPLDKRTAPYATATI